MNKKYDLLSADIYICDAAQIERSDEIKDADWEILRYTNHSQF